jgi:hypothetical protein
MAFLKTDSGDLIAMPAYSGSGEIGFVVARHIALQYTVPLFEVFDEFYQTPPNSMAELNLNSRLFRPIPMLLQFNKITVPPPCKWRILFNDPNYHPEQSNYSKIQIGYHHSGHTSFDLWEGGEKRSVSKEEVMQAERAIWWTPLHICIRASAHLAGLIGPTELYDNWKVVGLANTPENKAEFDKRFDVLMAQALVACEAMTAKFKQWDLAKKKSGQKRTKISQ